MSGLDPAIQAMAERLLRTSSAAQVTRALNEGGADVSYSQVDRVRRAMDKRGVNTMVERHHVGPASLRPDAEAIGPDNATRLAAQIGCTALLNATLRLMQRRASQWGCDIVTAGLRLHGHV